MACISPYIEQQEGWFKYDLSDLPRIHHVYFEKCRKIRRKFWGDHRKSQKLQAKYHEKEKSRMDNC